MIGISDIVIKVYSHKSVLVFYDFLKSQSVMDFAIAVAFVLSA